MTQDRTNDERPTSEIILSEGELEEDSVVKDSLTTAADGKLEEKATCKDYLQVRSEVRNDLKCMMGTLPHRKKVA